jgi:hypothetical protein
LKLQQREIKREIDQSKTIQKEYEQEGNKLSNLNQKLDDHKNKIDNASNAQVRFRTELLNAKQKMMELAQAGKEATPEYAALVEEAKRLQNAMTAANQQIKILTTTKGATLQGLVSGLSGLSGAFTAAQGAMGLFADKNEELQKIMLKVQSLMSITMGLQAVSAALHQTSAFKLMFLSKAQAAYSASMAVSNRAAQMGVIANVGLAASFRAVGAAIKAIPVLGWIVAGIGLLIGVVSKFTSKSREAKKATEEFYKAAAEGASKPIAEFKKLQTEWVNLAGSMDKKISIIKELKKMMEELGISINGVIDAEKILTDPANVQAFVNAQIAKAMASAKMDEITDLEKNAVIVKQKLEDAKKTPKVTRTMNEYSAYSYTYKVDNPEIKKQEEELKKITDKITAAITGMGKYQKEAITEMEKVTAGAIIKYSDGTVGALENAIKKERDALELLKGDNKAYKEKLKQIEALEEQLNAITGKKKKKEGKDPVLQELEEKKKAYQEYFTWMNAGFVKEAKQEFSTLLESGKTYKEYLENRKKKITGDLQEIGDKMKTMFPGNVDLLARPMIDAAELVKKGWKDAGDGIATVFSSQFGILDKDGKEVEILVTPILPDGSVLSEKELEDYIHNELEGANDILKADKKGIVISVGVNQDGSAGDILHKLQEQYYGLTELSSAQKDVLHKLNTAISEETQKTVLDEFEKVLQTELDSARSILEMLAVIEKKREDLKADDSGLKEQKTTVLDKQQEGVAKQAQEDYDKALKDYTDYLDSKLDYETGYLNKRKELELAIEKELDTARKAVLQQQLETLNIEHKTDKAENYDKLLQEYRSFEQKKLYIDKEYEKNKKLLEEKRDDQAAPETKRNEAAQALQELKKEYEKSLSDLSVEILQQSDTWQKLFTDLDTLTVSEMLKMKNTIEAEFKNLNLSPESLKALREQLDAVTEQVQKKNPFAALSDAIKKYKQDKSRANFKDLFEGIASSIDLIKGAFDSVAGGLKEMGLAGDDETQKLLGDISKMAEAAGNLATGIATGNPLQIIQGSVDLITSSIDMLDSGSRRRNEELKKEQEYYNALVDVYDVLIGKQKELTASMSGNKISEAYGEGLKMIEAQQRAAKSSLESWFSQGASWKSHSNWYNYDKDLGNILSRQKLLSMSAREWNEWMTANAEQFARLPKEVQDYAKAVMEADASTEELARTMQEASAGFSLDSARNELSELVKATDLSFKDISDSFYKNMEDAIMRIIQGRYDDRLKAWYQKVTDAMLDGELSEAEKNRLQKEYKDIIEDADRDYEAAKKLAGITDGKELSPNSLSGAIKGASQESIDLLAGQTNAVRLNQVEGIEIERNSLIQLTMINANTSRANQFLEQIEQNTKTNSYDQLRSQGITG